MMSEELTEAEREELRVNWSGRVGRVPANGLRLLRQLEQAERLEAIARMEMEHERGRALEAEREIARLDAEVQHLKAWEPENELRERIEQAEREKERAKQRDEELRTEYRGETRDRLRSDPRNERIVVLLDSILVAPIVKQGFKDLSEQNPKPSGEVGGGSASELIEFETNGGIIRGKPLVCTGARAVEAGETFKAEWRMPDHTGPFNLRWVLIAESNGEDPEEGS